MTLARLHARAVRAITGRQWHWYAHHFRFLPPHPFARSLIEACVVCEEHLPGSGEAFIDRIASYADRNRDEGHYEQLLQCCSEILVTRQAMEIDWGECVQFEIEPTAANVAARPDLIVSLPDCRIGFEIKTPRHFEHARRRQERPFQISGRMVSLREARHDGKLLFEEQHITLPRDNTVKDFLVSADQKFAGFKEEGNFTSILVIVWDDFVFEAVTPLVVAQAGLLTPNSYFRDDDGSPAKFPNVDGVIVVRHLMYFIEAARDRPLPDREHAFDFGEDGALPNIFFPVPGGQPISEAVLQKFRAIHYEDEKIQRIAEYLPVDAVLWLEK